MKRLLVFLGPPGAGKGQQSQHLQDQGWLTISCGHILREAAQKDSAEGRSVADCLKQGLLVPDTIVIPIITSYIAAQDGPLLLDGFPRTLGQAQALTSDGCIPSDVVIFTVSDDVVVERISGRYFDPHSGRVYHNLYHPPKVPGRDDLTGAALVRRDDDHPDVIRARLSIYHKQVKTLIRYYRSLQDHQALRLVYLNADDSIQNVQHALHAFLS